MSISTVPPPGTTRDPLYPDSDGKPMAETGFHVTAMIELLQMLALHFASRTDVYIAADMFLYYEQGNPRARRAPDVMFCQGVSGNHHRRSFRIWEEHVPPTVIFEVTSKKTRREDEVEKPAVYANIGVAEYFLFDPEGDYLRPRMRGYRLGPAGYQPIAPEATGKLIFLSHELGMTVELEGMLPRLTDVRTGERLRFISELGEEAAQAAVARFQAEQAYQQVERAKRQTKRAKQESERAKQESERAKQESEASRRRADEAERRAAALEAELKRLRGEQ